MFEFENRMMNNDDGKVQNKSGKGFLHFTVTDFARFRGVSGLWPLSTDM
jgi:hypothetical protein